MWNFVLLSFLGSCSGLGLRGLPLETDGLLGTTTDGPSELQTSLAPSVSSFSGVVSSTESTPLETSTSSEPSPTLATSTDRSRTLPNAAILAVAVIAGLLFLVVLVSIARCWIRSKRARAQGSGLPSARTWYQRYHRFSDVTASTDSTLPPYSPRPPSFASLQSSHDSIGGLAPWSPDSKLEAIASPPRART
ncbi:hypothetical protein C8J56DRAFT_194031 [Mycena floridula]|nr:hypothetical protein C8J56DRAFT_194031 [Mycena floridula]